MEKHMSIGERVCPRASPLLRALASDRRILALSSVLFGGVAVSLWPLWVGSGVLILLLGAIALRLVEIRRERQRTEAFTAFELALRQPDPEAMARLHAANEHFLIFDKTIEVLPHYSLSSRVRFSSLGWAPDDIQVYFQNERFDASEILTRVGGRKDFDPPNGRKFCLVDRSLAGTDTDLSLSLKETDYFTIRSVLLKLAYDLRLEFGSFDPALNRIPHSLCLHFLVRCGDGNVVCLLNEQRKAYAGGTWSVSAEEQLKDSDLDTPSPIGALFRRALLEEIFGLTDDAVPLSDRWARIEALVTSMRLWSVFVEEHINNFSLLGVYQLSVNTDVLCGTIQGFINDGSAARDLEGKLYVASQCQLESLLVTGSSHAVGLFSGKSTRVLSENLHWSARYRIFRLLRALKGGPLVSEGSTSARGGA